MNRRRGAGSGYQDGRYRVSTFEQATSDDVDRSQEQPSETNYGFLSSFYTSGDGEGLASFTTPPVGSRSSIRGYGNLQRTGASLRSLTSPTFHTDIPSEADVFSYTASSSQSQAAVPPSLQDVFSQFEGTSQNVERASSTAGSTSRHEFEREFGAETGAGAGADAASEVEAGAEALAESEAEGGARADQTPVEDEVLTYYYPTPTSTPQLAPRSSANGLRKSVESESRSFDSGTALLGDVPSAPGDISQPVKDERSAFAARTSSHNTLSSSLDTIDEPYDSETPALIAGSPPPHPGRRQTNAVPQSFQTPPPSTRSYRPPVASRPASMATVVSAVEVPAGPAIADMQEEQTGPAAYTDQNGAGPARQPRHLQEAAITGEPYSSDVQPAHAPDLNYDLHQLARDGDVSNVRRFLQDLQNRRLAQYTAPATVDGQHPAPLGKVDFTKKVLNAHDADGLSPLHYAARYNHVKIAQLLVEAGAHVDDADDERATPLHFAARYSHLRLIVHATSRFFEDEVTADSEAQQEPDSHLVTYLIRKGADCNRKDIHGLTPLHFAAIRGNEFAAQELVAQPNIVKEEFDNQRRTPLHLAVIHNKPKIVDILIKAGVNIRQHHVTDSTTALHLACVAGNEKIVGMLLDAAFEQAGQDGVGQILNDSNTEGNKPIHLSAEGRNQKVVALCLGKGANVNDLGQNDQRALHFAATSGSLPVVRHLVENGADLDASDRFHETALEKAAAQNHIKIISYLLNKGAKLKSKGRDNFSPLLIAAYNGHPETVSMLLERGANIFHMDRQERTAVFLAASQDHPDTLKVLLESPLGEDVMGLADSDGNTPLHAAAGDGFLTCAEMLLEAGASIDMKNEKGESPIHLAAQNGQFEMVHELLMHNRTVLNATDDGLNTALHLAATAGHYKIVKLLLRAGADITAKNNKNFTALDCSAATGKERVVQLLLEENAPVESHDNVSPLLLASARGHPKCASILLEKHASVTDVDQMGWNCLSLAIDHGHKDVAETIIASSQWREAMRNVGISYETKLRDTPMRKAIRKMPDVADKMLGRCTYVPPDVSPESPEYFIRYNYEFMDDIFTHWQEPFQKHFQREFHNRTLLRHNHPLMIMVREEEVDLLNHPLVTALLLRKWKYGSIVFYLNLFIYIILLIFLTGYMLATPSPFITYNAALQGAGSTADDLNDCEKIRQYYMASGVTTAGEKIFTLFGKYLILFIVVIEIIGELFQMIRYKFQYFNYENLMEWTLYIFTILLVIDFDQCQRDTGIRLAWQWQLGAVAIFLAWIEFVLSLRRVPRYGIYIVMFTDVLKTFVRFLPVLFLFIVAFGLAFYALMHNQVEFATVGISLLKTFVMMTGEFELGDLLLDGRTSTVYEDQLVLPPAIYIMYTLFVLCMTIIMMNLLVGLAVDDVKGIMETATIKRRGMQVELALDLENMLPTTIRRRMVTRHEVYYPNECWKNPLNYLIASKNRTGEDILEYITPNLNIKEQIEFRRDRMVSQIQDKMEYLEGHVDNILGMVRSLQDTQDTLLRMNKKMMESQGIDWREETDAELFGI